MQILHDRKAKKLWLSQEKYVERVLERFNMKHAKPVSTPLGGHFKLSKKSCPSSNKEKENMASIPYSSAVGSLMYVMVCTRPDIAYAVGVVSRFMVNPSKEHWEAVKWIFKYLRGSSNSCLSFGSSKPVLEEGSYLLLQGELYHGSLNYKSVSLYLQLRLSILQRPKQGNRCFGWNDFSKTSVCSKTSM